MNCHGHAVQLKINILSIVQLSHDHAVQLKLNKLP